jgi:hypothetical protein
LLFYTIFLSLKLNRNLFQAITIHALCRKLRNHLGPSVRRFRVCRLGEEVREQEKQLGFKFDFIIPAF